MIIPGFKGGLANSLFDPVEIQTYQDSSDLDVFSSSNILTPIYKIGSDTMNGGGTALSTTKVQAAIKASNGSYYLIGNSGTSDQRRLFSASSLGSDSTLGTEGTSATASTAPSLNNLRAMLELDGSIFFHNSSTILSRYVIATDTYTEVWQTPTGGGLTDAFLAHGGLKLAFFAGGNIIHKWDGTTFTDSALTLSANWTVESMCEYGRFVLIGAGDDSQAKNSQIFIWDGSATTVDDIISVGDTGLQVIRNVNGEVHILTVQQEAGFTQNFCRIYTWSGGQVLLRHELDLGPTTNSTPARIRDSAVDVYNDALYFGFDAKTSGVMGMANGVYIYGKDKITGRRVLTLGKLTATAQHGTPDSSNISITGLRQTGKITLVFWTDGTTYYVNHQIASTRRSIDGVYESNAFLIGKGGPRKIKRITINHKPLPTDCGFTVQVKHYGHYPKGTSVPSEDSYADLTTNEGSGSSTGKTQSTTNTTYTEIDQPNVFKEARYAQIKIKFDEISTNTAASIIFPILIETE